MNDKPATTAGEDFDLEKLGLDLEQTSIVLQAISEAMFFASHEAKYYSPGIVHCADFLSSLADQIQDFVDFTYRKQ